MDRHQFFESLGRDVTGRVSHQCRCINHDSWSDSSVYSVINIKKSRKVPKGVETFLRKNKILPVRANFICTACVSTGTNLLADSTFIIEDTSSTHSTEPMQGHDTQNRILETVDHLIELLSTADNTTIFNVIPKEKISKLLVLLGRTFVKGVVPRKKSIFRKPKI